VARGWESKSVEAQQEEAAQKTVRTGEKIGREEAKLRREKEGLRLARKRVLHQIEASTNSRHRTLLEEALAELDRKLAQ
jgi:hypothetical protein